MSETDRPQSPIATPPAPVVPLRPGYGVPASEPVRRRRRHGGEDGSGNGNGTPGGGGGGDGHGDGDGRRRVRIRKLRVLALLIGLGLLAADSTVFVMMMAVASDLPALEQPATDNTVIYDVKGRNIGVLTGNQKRIYLREDEIAPVMKHAIIAIEDRRFYTNEGVDLRGIGRALWQDVVAQKAVQGGSTITQQFVKNALAAQQQRTLFQKLREAALAYHLTRKWSKEQILRNYLNTIYFGNGAYGIESAARTYFAKAHPGCDRDGSPRTCASQLTPGEAALIAGIVQNPSGYDPLAHPDAAKRRRDAVLRKMLDQGFLIRPQYDAALQEPLPSQETISPPQENTRYPYFTSWVKQQVVDRLGGGQQGARLAFEGGLRVRTTIDADMQDAAQQAIEQTLPNVDGPRAALVAIDNRTGAVRAMVGGDDYNSKPFNLATQGQRQPGSSIKPFILSRALSDGISAGSTWESRKLVIDVPHSIEKFTVNNYANAYSGVSTLARALTFSDNSVFAQVGIKVGTRRVARLAERMGIRTPVSSNYAMTLGGLKQGVTPLDMAHAYETIASGGKLVYGSLSPGVDNGPHDPVPGPVGIASIRRRNGSEWRPVKLPGGEPALNRTRTRRVLDPAIASEVGSIMQSVVAVGSGTRAQVPGYTVSGKTGTTEAYGDAWFVGWAGDITVAVWVGYPDGFQPMKTEFNGQPVAGGTFPAAIFSTFMRAVLPQKVDASALTPTAPSTTGPSTTAPAAPSATPAPSTGGTAPAAPQTQQAPTAPAPSTPAPAAPPSGGGGGGGGTGGAGTGGGAAPPG
ncbi:MAG: penicillin-binding protein [Solirubrobacteraceae bacterium]|nr:penicillin-binding protein [Solirubrobacteraceae bacterium]